VRTFLGRRALIVEVGVLVIAAAVWWFAFWSPAQSRKHDAVHAFGAYAARLPATWREGADIVDSQHRDDSYLVCSRRAEAEAGVQHLCLTVHIDVPEARRVVGGYRIKTVGYDLPMGEKRDCFGFDRGECVQGNG
jgi:hypothetical protein